MYISATHGCDFGYCDDEDAYIGYNNFCDYTSFYTQENSVCCSKYNKSISNSIPFINHTLKPLINCSDTVIINGSSQIFQSKEITANTFVEGSTSLQKQFAVCFKTENNYLCKNPVINVMYEMIDYNSLGGHESFYINYSNGSKICNPGNADDCGFFADCYVDENYIEPFWSSDQGKKVLYFRNGYVCFICINL